MSPPTYGNSENSEIANLGNCKPSNDRLGLLVKKVSDRCGQPTAVPTAEPTTKPTANTKEPRKRSSAKLLLVQDFLIPCLEDERYGRDLVWMKRQKGIFCINWMHQGSRAWSKDQGAVFKDWVHIKSGWQKDDPLGMVKAKQRIRAAFSKSPHLKCIYKCNRYRIYQIRHIKGLLIGQAAWSDTSCREWHDVISVTSSPPRPRPWQEHENQLLKSTRQTERSLKKKKKKRHSPGRLYRTTFCLPIVNPLGPPTPHEIFLSTGDASWFLHEELCDYRVLVKCVYRGGVDQEFFDQLEQAHSSRADGRGSSRPGT
ncbi:uncharacterized protein LOC115319748 isoform X2 [Ixodes scapularis]|uniref:uncharacterized protein LOC115319748 isoform X2 n=1 Tax=Ixodes scapularis TaxID=6945 RepID=UPI001C38F298|nr:uncharacterized protein LOC115319748 isoform X2 [Ixodes scapularis]